MGVSRYGYETNNGPGSRFSTGSSRGDHLLGTFGFVTHMFFFLFIGALICYHWQDHIWNIMLTTGVIAGMCLVIRGAIVGVTTTKESLKAIKEAWTR